MKKMILLLPGTGQKVGNYKDYAGLEIWMKAGLKNELTKSDCLIGHSLGASFALAYNTNPDCRFILINPLVHKKSLAILIWRWLKFMSIERFEMKKAVPFKYWPYAFRKVLDLVEVDVLNALNNLPKDNISIIRGKKDSFFCDDEAVKIIKEKGFKLFEVEAGHDWNENIAGEVKRIIKM